MRRAPAGQRRAARALSGAAAAALLVLSGAAWAGRPMTVDDAEVAEVGEGQVETWLARDADRSHAWTSALGVGVWPGVELGATFARNTSAHEHTTGLQAKFLLTPVVQGGCNLGALLGLAHTDRGVGRSHGATALLSCQLPALTLHGNLGMVRAQGGPTLATWGVAAQKAFGAVTAHLEFFGEQHGRPTVQAGLSREVARNLQLDGTLGRFEGRTVFSVGLAFSF